MFITTSDFTDEARNHAKNNGNMLVLIEGQKLAKLFVEYGVGMRPNAKEVFVIKGVDLSPYQEANGA